MNDETNKALAQTNAPESFPSELLKLPVGARQEYFEQRCLISHPRLLEAFGGHPSGDLPAWRRRKHQTAWHDGARYRSESSGQDHTHPFA